MTTFTMRHEIHCSEERFWELFFDNDLQKEIFKELQFPKWEVMESKETPTEIVRIVNAVPKLDAPGPVAKILGSNFGYVEEGRYDRASKTYTFVIKTNTLSDKLRNSGTVKLEAKGEGKVTRVVEVDMEAKIFGVGGMIEKMTEKNMRDGWGKSADIFNARLKG